MIVSRVSFYYYDREIDVQLRPYFMAWCGFQLIWDIWAYAHGKKTINETVF